MKKNEQAKNNDAVTAASTGLRIPGTALLAGLGLMAGANPASAQQGPPPPSSILPVAADDNYLVGLNGVLFVDPTGTFQRPLQLNDTFDANHCDPNVSIQLLSLPVHGSLELSTNVTSVGDSVYCADTNTFGGFTYIPDTDFAGTDTFRYALVDATTGDSSNATVNIVTSSLPNVGSMGLGLLAPVAALALLRRRKKDQE